MGTCEGRDGSCDWKILFKKNIINGKTSGFWGWISMKTGIVCDIVLRKRLFLLSIEVCDLKFNQSRQFKVFVWFHFEQVPWRGCHGSAYVMRKAPDRVETRTTSGGTRVQKYSLIHDWLTYYVPSGLPQASLIHSCCWSERIESTTWW